MTAEEAAPWSDLVGSFGAYQLEKNPRLFRQGPRRVPPVPTAASTPLRSVLCGPPHKIYVAFEMDNLQLALRPGNLRHIIAGTT